ncbi:MAG: alanine racemase [Saprospiraceae bacterium]|nr:alanine racemase [Saprospiraceae bacterium]
MTATSTIQISRSALEHNLAFIREIIGPKVKYSSVVKGNAYGHGVNHFVPLAEKCGVDHFSVFSCEEAVEVLDSASPDSTIMIMGFAEGDALAWAIENGVEFYVFDIERLKNAVSLAKTLDTKAKVHLELETGMNRTGLLNKNIDAYAKFINKHNESLEIKGMCTHYAGAENVANYYRIVKQKKKFDRMVEKFRKKDIRPERNHTACSAAALRYSKTHMDMVRIGILQYGFFPSPETMIEYLNKKKKKDYPLRRVVSWTSRIMHIKPVKAGEYVGYGTSFLASDDMKIAIVPIGYSDGFSRILSNQGRVLIHDQRVAVIGMVNMNMLAVDISKIESVNKGDEVTLIGKQGDLEVSVASFSEYSRQINYEMLVRLPRDIPRSVVD